MRPRLDVHTCPFESAKMPITCPHVNPSGSTGHFGSAVNCGTPFNGGTGCCALNETGRTSRMPSAVIVTFMTEHTIALSSRVVLRSEGRLVVLRDSGTAERVPTRHSGFQRPECDLLAGTHDRCFTQFPVIDARAILAVVVLDAQHVGDHAQAGVKSRHTGMIDDDLACRVAAEHRRGALVEEDAALAAHENKCGFPIGRR